MNTLSALSAGEGIALLLWDVGEGLAFLAAKTWCKSVGGPQAVRSLSRRLRQLEQRQVLSREQRAREMIYRLTATGRQQALGGRDPVSWWNRPADGRWYLMVFDLPKEEHTTRIRLLRWLRRNGFGYLQDSVWISPDSPAKLTEALRPFQEDVEALTVLEARCAAGYTNAALVRGAWKFDLINRRYRTMMDHCDRHVGRWRSRPAERPTPATVGDALSRARQLWLAAVRLDPLLPRPLWPAGYAGEEALSAMRRLRDAAVAVLELPGS